MYLLRYISYEIIYNIVTRLAQYVFNEYHSISIHVKPTELGMEHSLAGTSRFKACEEPSGCSLKREASLLKGGSSLFISNDI